MIGSQCIKYKNNFSQEQKLPENLWTTFFFKKNDQLTMHKTAKVIPYRNKNLHRSFG